MRLNKEARDYGAHCANIASIIETWVGTGPFTETPAIVSDDAVEIAREYNEGLIAEHNRRLKTAIQIYVSTCNVDAEETAGLGENGPQCNGRTIEESASDDERDAGT